MPDFSEFAKTIWKLHYQTVDKDGSVEESPSQVISRICNAYSQEKMDKKLCEKLYKLQMNRYFSFNSPVYYNLGTGYKQNLAACFVGDIEDSLDSIGEWNKIAMLVFQTGAGIGLPIWKLRSFGASLGDGGKKNMIREDDAGNMFFAGPASSGSVSYMRIFDAAGQTVKSANKRRAAIMMTMMDSHPDLLKFIEVKTGDERVYHQNMNLSVLCTDKFMKAVQEDKEWELKWNGSLYKTLPAKNLMKQIAEAAWDWADPGVLFYDTINRDNLAPSMGPIECTNPCGEQPLHPNTTCNLGSINLYQLAKTMKLKKDKLEEGEIKRFLDRIGEIVVTITPFMDKNIDICEYPHKVFEENSKKIRNLGIGLSGLAEMLAYLRIPYTSSEGRELAKLIMARMTISAWIASYSLSEKEGCAPIFKRKESRDAYKNMLERYSKSIKHNGWTRFSADVRAELETDLQLLSKLTAEDKFPRNTSVTTVAPTGNTGLAFDSGTTGCEPIFALAYKRRITQEDGSYKEVTITDPEFKQALEEYGITLAPSKIIAAEGKVGKLTLPRTLREVFATSSEIDWRERIAMQAALQTFCTSAISSTINLPSSTTKDEVEDIIVEAYRSGCKGITLFRQGCKIEGILSTSNAQANKDFERPIVMSGSTFKTKMIDAQGHPFNMYITVNEDQYGKPKEVFVNAGGVGTRASASMVALGKLMSGMLQMNEGDIDKIISALQGVKSDDSGRVWLSTTDTKPVNALSMEDCIAKVLQKYHKGYIEEATITECPKCGSESIRRESGCITCASCGWSRC